LENDLRVLTQPEVPAGLESRILHAISSAAVPEGRARRWPPGRVLAIVGVAAAILIVLILRGLPAPRPSAGSRPGDLGNTSPMYIVIPYGDQRLKETKPWNVQPPLPSRYSA
jgi:hypothetical protein